MRGSDPCSREKSDALCDSKQDWPTGRASGHRPPGAAGALASGLRAAPVCLPAKKRLSPIDNHTAGGQVCPPRPTVGHTGAMLRAVRGLPCERR